MNFEEVKKMLLENVKIENECWIWKKSLFPKDGYGQVQVNKKKYRAHRLSYLVFKNQDPGKLYVCHTCDNRRCINPDHLWLGTANQNTKDSLKKGRFAFIKGENHTASRLKEKDVIEIKRLCRNGMYQKDVAKIFGITQSNVSCIMRGLIWSYID